MNSKIPRVTARAALALMFAGALLASGVAEQNRLQQVTPLQLGPPSSLAGCSCTAENTGSANESVVIRAQSPMNRARGFLPQSDRESKRLHGQLSLARLTERRGQTEQARHLYAQYIQKQPNNPMPYHRLGIIEAKAKRYAKAEEYLRKAAAMGPPSAKLLSDYGYLCYLQNRLGQAEELLRQALQRDSEYTAANNNLGLVLGEQQRFAESLAAFKRAVSTGQAHSNLAFVLAQMGEHEQALSHYSKALDHKDDNLRRTAEALVQLAEQRPELIADVATEEEPSEVQPRATQDEQEAQAAARPPRRRSTNVAKTKPRPTNAKPRREPELELAEYQEPAPPRGKALPNSSSERQQSPDAVVEKPARSPQRAVVENAGKRQASEPRATQRHRTAVDIVENEVEARQETLAAAIESVQPEVEQPLTESEKRSRIVAAIERHQARKDTTEPRQQAKLASKKQTSSSIFAQDRNPRQTETGFYQAALPEDSLAREVAPRRTGPAAAVARSKRSPRRSASGSGAGAKLKRSANRTKGADLVAKPLAAPPKQRSSDVAKRAGRSPERLVEVSNEPAVPHLAPPTQSAGPVQPVVHVEPTSHALAATVLQEQSQQSLATVPADVVNDSKQPKRRRDAPQIKASAVPRSPSTKSSPPPNPSVPAAKKRRAKTQLGAAQRVTTHDGDLTVRFGRPVTEGALVAEKWKVDAGVPPKKTEPGVQVKFAGGAADAEKE